MQFSGEDIEAIVRCTCLANEELDIQDLLDADLCDPQCPAHGVKAKLKQE